MEDDTMASGDEAASQSSGGSPTPRAGGDAATMIVSDGGDEKSVTQMIDEMVFDLLKGLGAASQQQTLNIAEDEARFIIHERGGLHGLSAFISASIWKVYPGVGFDIAMEIADKAAECVKAALDGTNSSTGVFDTDLQERLHIAFTELGYIGDAGNKFVEYLKRSWNAYQRNRNAFVAPYASIVQSSGFGKSRLLYELAQKTIKPKATIEQNDCDMRVLYTCTRLGRSTGFPAATVKLRGWLFGSNHTEFTIANHLEAIYHYAQENWSTVDSEWIKLFTDAKADEAVQKKLEAFETELRSKREESAKKASTDEAAQVQRNALETSEEQKSSEDQPAKVVILAVDEARVLLELKHRGINYFRLLRRALGHANKSILASHPAGGIFAVLVDTNSKVSDLTPPSWSDPSSRNDRAASSVPRSLFPPFVGFRVPKQRTTTY